MDDLNNKTLKGYQLIQRLGAGGFGAVYRAFQPIVEREVAVKIILPEHANHPEFIRNFDTEAKLVARLEHPHIVPLFDYWRDPDGAYIVMRLLKGGSLGGAIKHQPLSLESAAQMLDQVGSALVLAHRNGIVHRDIKPDNILRDEDGNNYLTDFGIALVLGAEDGPDEVSGSLAYMPPEQLKSEPLTQRADIYSLGMVLYEALTAKHPFQGNTVTEIIYKQINDPLPEIFLVRPDLPGAVNDVIQMATAKEPENRFADGRAMAAAFRQAISLGEMYVTEVTDWSTDIGEVVNPYKGLRAFDEADADDFFGREALTDQLLARMQEETDFVRFLAVIGPSGSGKSSVVRAGLIPMLRGGMIPGSENWFVINMIPGDQPIKNLEAVLLGIASHPPTNLYEQLKSSPRGLLWATDTMLANTPGDLLLLVDQFETIFTQVEDESERAQFLELIRVAVTDRKSRLRVIVTMRADFYDRPLLYDEFGTMMQARAQIVLPLSVDEIDRAITGPAMRVGLYVDPNLVVAMISDVRKEPGALPLLQYALTELFERSDGREMMLSTYVESGGVLGALARRAEEVYSDLTLVQQVATRQIFLRLIALGEGTEDTSRPAKISELLAVGSNRHVVQAVLDAYGQFRLLTFDRDSETREPTVRIAHEALIREWSRFRRWLDDGRDDIRQQRLLANAALEWRNGAFDNSYLLVGTRLIQFTEWAGTTDLALTPSEQRFLRESSVLREKKEAEERARQEREAALERQSVNRMRIFIGVLMIGAVGLTVLNLFFLDRFSAQVDRRVEDKVRIPGLLMNAGLLEFDSVENGATMRQMVGEELIDGMIIGTNNNIFFSLNQDYIGKNIEDVPGLDNTLFSAENPRESTLEMDSALMNVAPIYTADGQTARLFAYVKVGTTGAEQEKIELRQLFLFAIGGFFAFAILSILLSMSSMIMRRLFGQ